MPFPQNLQVAKELEDVVRQAGAVPATIAIIDGIPRIGLSEEHLLLLAKNTGEVKKASTRDLAYVCAKKMHAATTVASTMKLASLAGVKVFATGGIGGVHRGAEVSMDVSADLVELSRTPVTVVCAGIKSILDIPKSLEVLETHGVPVVGYQTKSFPAFFTNDSGVSAPGSVSTALDVAQMMKHNEALHISSGVVVAVPNPNPADETLIHSAISSALLEAERQGIRGAAITPFLLSRIEKMTGGKSLESNIALVKNNTKVASQIAVEYANLNSGKPSTVISSPVIEVKTAKQSEATPVVSTPSTSSTQVDVRSVSRDQNDIIVIGGAVMDIISRVEATITRPNTSNPGFIETSYGGVGRNIAQAMASHGVDVALATSVGDDDRGRSILLHAKNLGMDTSCVKILRNGENAEETNTDSVTWNTASYSAIHDQNGDLNVGVADMSIFTQINADYIQSIQSKILNSQLIVMDGNIPKETFKAVAELCAENKKPIFFEPTSDHKCLLPFRADAFHHISIIKPNLTELIQLVSYAMQNDFIRTSKATVSTTLANIVSNRIDNHEQIDLVDIRILTTALYRVMLSKSSGKTGIIHGKHVLVSMGKNGVLWCGPLTTLTPEEKVTFTKSNRLVISGTDNCMTCHFPAEAIEQSSSMKHSTNGAGDNFCGGYLANIIAQYHENQSRSHILNSELILPNTKSITAGLLSAKSWLLRK